MATGTGLNVSKVNAYAVLWSNPGLNVSKANAYAILASADVTPPSWPLFTFADGVKTFAYSQQFTPLGAGTVTVTVASGALPDGLSLSNVTGNTYQISGTPTVADTFAFTLRASNSYGTADKACSITIDDVVTSGNGGSWCFAA